MNKTLASRFTVSVPVKPYVKRYLELNYGNPVHFTHHAESNKFFLNLLRNPKNTRDAGISEEFFVQSAIVEIYISEHDFYRYGWELTKTNTVVFGRHFEDHTKLLMRNIVGLNVSLGLPINKSIKKFQKEFQFHEDIWSFESIKKDFYRNGCTQIINFDTDIYFKLTNLILRNLSDFGTYCVGTIKEYEKDK